MSRKHLPAADRYRAAARGLQDRTACPFMVKDSKKYATTGGWGFGQFTNGEPDGEALHKTCFSCHQPAKGQDLVFTRYAPSP
jgi:Cytochrome P460